MNTYDLEFIDTHGERNMHTALITNLKPNTRYVFRIFYSNQFQGDHHVYKTLPDKANLDNHTITMINSGDSGHTDVV